MKKSKFSEWAAEFSVYSSDKSKNFLLKFFLKILQNGGAHEEVTASMITAILNYFEKLFYTKFLRIIQGIYIEVCCLI